MVLDEKAAHAANTCVTGVWEITRCISKPKFIYWVQVSDQIFIFEIFGCVLFAKESLVQELAIETMKIEKHSQTQYLPWIFKNKVLNSKFDLKKFCILKVAPFDWKFIIPNERKNGCKDLCKKLYDTQNLSL